MTQDRGVTDGPQGERQGLLRQLAAEQERLRLQHAMTRALADADSADEGFRRVLAAVCEGLGWQLGALWQTDDAGGQLRFTAAWHAPGVDVTEFEADSRTFAFTPGRGMLGGAWQTGAPVWVEDVTVDTHFARAALITSMGMRSALAVPIRIGGRVVAILEFLSRERRARDYALLDLLETLGVQVGQAVERKRAEEALRESEQRWATTLASIGDAVIATDTAGRVTFMNPVAEALTGWASQEAMQHPVQEVFHIVNEATHRRVEDPVSKVLGTGLIFGLANHTLLVRRDGTEVAIDDSGAPVRDAEGGTGGVVLVFRDITERRRAELELRQNRDHLAIILQGVADGITAQLADGSLVYANDAAARLTGFASVRELLDAPPRSVLDRFDILDEAGQPLAMDQLPGRVALRTGRSAVATVRYRVRGTDQERWSIDRAVPVLDQQGRPEMAVNIIQDITERRRAEQVLQETLTLTQELYTSSRGIGMANAPDDVLRVLLSTSYLRNTGRAFVATYDYPWTAESGIPEGVEVLTAYTRPDLDPGAVPVTVGQHFPTSRILLDELQLRTRPWVVGDVTQEPRISEENRARSAAVGVRAFAVFPLIAGGVNFGVMAFYFDALKALSPEDVRHVQGVVDQAAVGISNQLVLEKEQRARQQAERANELRLRFLGMISHELRTPLTSIKGFATTLLAEDVTWDTETQRDFLHTIDQEADKLTEMIGQLLDLSRIESGALSVDPHPQALAAVVDAAWPQLTAIAKQHAFAADIPGNLPAVRADGPRIGQVLTNLVGNAAKYTPPGTPISLSAAEHGAGFVRVSVADEGPGIAPEDQPHLFEAFRRGSDSTARQTKGAGLGLAICKGIVEAHGGSIWFGDNTPRGTVVFFTLPTAPTATP